MNEMNFGALLQGGKYKIEKVLGQGGFGITYLAEQTNLGRKVCIKEFFMKEYGERVDSSKPITDATVLTGVSAVTSAAAEIMGRYREKFVKEARTIARLDHPGIVRIHDVFEENGTAYYVMDFIEGENLNDLVKREGSLPEERALGYIRQVAEALSYVHDHRIMHLDVKPANIIRRSDDKVVLIDFGTAKQYDSTGTQTSTTPVGLSVGYAPIELMNVGGVKTFSPETDVYSLGATLYYLVTGKNPPGASERMEMIMEGEVLDYPESVSKTMASAIEQALQSRKKRPQTVTAFMELLPALNNVAPEKKRPEFCPNCGEKLTPSTNFCPNCGTKVIAGNRPEAEEVPRHIEEQDRSEMKEKTSDIVSILDSKNRLIATIPGTQVQFSMVLVKAGSFTMGATAEQGITCEPDEKPTHRVALTRDYYMGEHEVTQELYEAVMGNNPSHFNGAHLPVEQVDWDDAQAFCTRLSTLTGRIFRLPTEAEWEYAARGGHLASQQTKYAGSNDINVVAWYKQNSEKASHAVGTMSANALGLYDMSGNVGEWCSDWYGDYGSAAQTDPTGPSSGSYRVLRGGSWSYDALDCRVSERFSVTPSDRFFALGFRLVCVPQ